MPDFNGSGVLPVARRPSWSVCSRDPAGWDAGEDGVTPYHEDDVDVDEDEDEDPDDEDLLDEEEDLGDAEEFEDEDFEEEEDEDE